MTSSSPEDSMAPEEARSVVATEWDPQDLLGGSGGGWAAPDAEEQDQLIEAMVQANAQREQALVADTDRRVAEAYALGFEEGRQEGEAAEGARLRSAVAAVEDALEELQASENRWRGGLEENICALAVAVAKHVLGRELRGDLDGVLAIVRRAVAEFPIDQPIRIRVAPRDLAMITAASAGESPPVVAPGRESRWLADPHIAPGGCVVEGRDHIVDGRVDTALERLYRRLTYTNA